MNVALRNIQKHVVDVVTQLKIKNNHSGTSESDYDTAIVSIKNEFYKYYTDEK